MLRSKVFPPLIAAGDFIESHVSISMRETFLKKNKTVPVYNYVSNNSPCSMFPLETFKLLTNLYTPFL